MKSCNNILHVLEDGRHRVIENELNYSLQEFGRLKNRYSEQKIYYRMYVFLATLIHEYKDYNSGMVKKVKNTKKRINENITRVKEELRKYQQKHAFKDITHVHQIENTWYEQPRRPFFL